MPMRIMHLRSAEFYGSPERLIVGQCLHISELDFVCASYVRGEGDNRFLEECQNNNVPTAVLRESFAGDFRVVGQIQKLINSCGVSLLVTHDYKSNFYGYFAARREKIPQVAYFHGVTSEDAKVGIYNRIDRFMLHRMSKVIAVSSMTSNFLQSRGLPKSKIEVVPNAIDSTSLRTDCPSRSASNKICKVIAIGRFSYEKGFDILLEAVARIMSEAPPFELLLYGLGPEEKRLREQVERLGLSNTVRFCGFVDSVLPALATSDFMVMSSRSEGMPVAILEAWSQRIGVLATSVGGIPEMIESGRSGLLVPSEDIGELSAKLLWSLNNRDRMYRFGQVGYDLVRERYTFEVQAEQLGLIYSNLIDPDNRPKPPDQSTRSY